MEKVISQLYWLGNLIMLIKGNILIILLLMLLFSSAVVLKLSENNYLAHLINTHLDHLASARKALAKAVVILPSENQVCSINTDNKSELEIFWQSRQSLCQLNISGIKIDYAMREFSKALEETIYQQVTLRTQNGSEFEWLRIVKIHDSGALVSWTYYF